MLTIDGSQGEGGGQVLRSALALSLVTGRPFQMTRIRGGRKKPGLLRQHLTAVRAAARIGRAEARGAELRSTELTFEPGDVQPGEYHFAIGTAGTARLLQHWRHHKFSSFRPFFCQIEAVEAVIWLAEVAPKQGKEVRGTGLPLPKYSWHDPYLALTLYRSQTAVLATLPEDVSEALAEAERVGWQWLMSKGQANSKQYAEAMEVDERTASGLADFRSGAPSTG